MSENWNFVRECDTCGKTTDKMLYELHEIDEVTDDKEYHTILCFCSAKCLQDWALGLRTERKKWMNGRETQPKYNQASLAGADVILMALYGISLDTQIVSMATRKKQGNSWKIKQTKVLGLMT